jgi:hypothetical protein
MTTRPKLTPAQLLKLAVGLVRMSTGNRLVNINLALLLAESATYAETRQVRAVERELAALLPGC